MLTGLATATFPDGSLPEVIDVVRIAANLFAAGQETTVRLLASALLLLGERPELQVAAASASPSAIPNFVEETLRFESPIKGDFRLSRVPTTIGGVDIPAGTTVMVLARRGQPRPATLRRARRVPPRPGRTRANTSRSGTASTPARALRSPAPRRASASSASSTG